MPLPSLAVPIVNHVALLKVRGSIMDDVAFSSNDGTHEFDVVHGWARCAFSDRFFHSVMPLSFPHMFARSEHACGDQWHSSRESTALTVVIINHVETSKGSAQEVAAITDLSKTGGTVRAFRQKFTIEDAIGSHACSLEASTRVTNGSPLGYPPPLTVTTVNSVKTLKATQWLLRTYTIRVMMIQPCGDRFL
jgi:hypothetical protein